MLGRVFQLLFVPLAINLIAISDSFVDAGENDRPNIIFIMVDDLGFNDLGCYGQKVIKTPCLDKMAAEGIRFTDVYAGSPVCAPSRSVLMTGLHTGHTTVRGNVGKFGVRGLGGRKGRVPLLDSDVTVAEILKKSGYVTAMIGKWGLGEPQTSGEPGKQGWDYFYGFLNQRQAHDHYPTYLWRNQTKIQLRGNHDGKQKQHTELLFIDEAVGFIKRQAKNANPFFLYLPLTLPHTKFQIPSTKLYDKQPWTKNEKIHAAMVSQIDSDVGRILALLAELQIDKKTIVFFCSDNGAHSRWEKRFDSSHPLRGKKRDVYEGGIRVPMIVRWPGHIAKGKTSDTPWAFWDVLPTLAEVGGAKNHLKHSIDGVSVLPTLLSKPQTELSERFLYWEFFERKFVQAGRMGRWKAVRFAKRPIQIYDLKKDISETTDLATSRPDLVSKFEKKFKQARTKSKNWPSPID